MYEHQGMHVWIEKPWDTDKEAYRQECTHVGTWTPTPTHTYVMYTQIQRHAEAHTDEYLQTVNMRTKHVHAGMGAILCTRSHAEIYIDNNFAHHSTLSTAPPQAHSLKDFKPVLFSPLYNRSWDVSFFELWAERGKRLLDERGRDLMAKPAPWKSSYLSWTRPLSSPRVTVTVQFLFRSNFSLYKW